MDEAGALIAAFCSHRGVPDTRKNRFGSPALHVSGISDGNAGVQWNTWVQTDGDEQMAFVGVNLEGKKYDGWPIGRFIERELQQAELFGVLPRIPRVHDVEVIWYRDAWQAASRPPIQERVIGGSPCLLHELTPDQWTRLLREAGECLGPGYRGRARQPVTVKSGRKEYPVSPHVQFRRRFWRRSPALGGWKGAIHAVFEDMQPLYEFVLRRTLK